MSEQKVGLATSLLSQLFGERVCEVGKYLCLWKKATLSDIKVENARESLAVLIQHNMVTFQKSPKGNNVTEYALDIDSVLNALHYPKYCLQLKNLLGEEAELIASQLLKRGQESASGLILRCFSSANKDEVSTEEKDVDNLYQAFCKLVSLRFVMRVTVSKEDSEADEEDPFLLPSIKTSDILSRVKNPQPKTLPDAAIFWRINDNAFKTGFRDDLIALAVSRRVDETAGNLMGLILKHADADWDEAVSKHFYLTDIVDSVAASGDAKLKQFREQYLRVLEEDRLRFVDKVGDQGGGAFQVNFGHLFTQLVAATLENVVLEKFGSKALRIFRLIREKKYVEESQIQGLVMMPIKETKLLTYQLLENNFIQLQELKKSLASNAPSKSFYLFYVDINRVSRMVLDMCHKSVNNMLIRQEHEVTRNQRLLEKKNRVDAMIEEVKKSVENPKELDIQLQDIYEMMSAPEKAQVKYVHNCLGKLWKASYQVDETIFLINMYLLLAAK